MDKGLTIIRLRLALRRIMFTANGLADLDVCPEHSHLFRVLANDAEQVLVETDVHNLNLEGEG